MKLVRPTYAAIYETRLVENEALVVTAPPVRLEVLTGPAYTYPLSQDRAVVPLRGVLGEEVAVPPPRPIDLEDGKRYIILSTITSDTSDDSESRSRSLLARTAVIVGLLASPSLFALPIYVGWLGSTPGAPVRTTVMFSRPETFQRRPLEKSIQAARSALARDESIRDRFDLMARLYSRTIGLPPSEESYLWAWTCLEVFPMMGTQKYHLIAPYLAEIVGLEAGFLAEALDIKGLHRLRSKLVHSGQTGLSVAVLYERLSRVQAIVETVLSGMCGLPYSDKLNRHLRPTSA